VQEAMLLIIYYTGDFHGSERDWDISQYHFKFREKDDAYELGVLYDKREQGMKLGVPLRV
jgi:hypothetical protein